MTFGTWLGGQLDGRIPVLPALVGSGIGSAVALGLFWMARRTAGYSPVIFLITDVNAVLVTNLQLRLMELPAMRSRSGQR